MSSSTRRHSTLASALPTDPCLVIASSPVSTVVSELISVCPKQL
jgi:hypothetical protein